MFSFIRLETGGRCTTTHVRKNILAMMHTFAPEKKETTSMLNTILSLESVTALLTHVGMVH